MSTPQVSVIIPTCNRPDLLSTAIRSVLDQTYSDLEVVVVDDASDASIESVVRALQDQRIRYIRHEYRRGAAAARNTGIRSTEGEFVAFLDDDDQWHPEKLARQVFVLLRSHPNTGAIYTGYDIVDRDSGKAISRMLPEHRGDVSLVLLRGNCVGPTSSFLVRRKCFETVGMFDESLPSFQEYDLWIRLSRAYHFDYVAECLFNYCVHSKRISTNPEAICKGVGILLRKYGASETFRKTCSRRYLFVAVQYCEGGEGVKARAALRRAISLHPLDPRYYFYYCLSLLNTGMYQWVQECKATILGCLTLRSRDRVS
jgi:glycosyltransferase involved in cell wall biosynthesis